MGKKCRKHLSRNRCVPRYELLLKRVCIGVDNLHSLREYLVVVNVWLRSIEGSMMFGIRLLVGVLLGLLFKRRMDRWLVPLGVLGLLLLV